MRVLTPDWAAFGVLCGNYTVSFLLFITTQPSTAVRSKGSLSVLFKPFQNGANTAAGQGNARIRRAIIQVDSVAIRSNCVAARKDDVVHIPAPLIGFFRAKDPLVATF